MFLSYFLGENIKKLQNQKVAQNFAISWATLFFKIRMTFQK
jgi:hypothetical protein